MAARQHNLSIRTQQGRARFRDVGHLLACRCPVGQSPQPGRLPAARKQAVETIGIVRPLHSATIPTLTQALADEAPEVRAAAATALGLMGSRAKSAIPELTKLLEDKDEPVRTSAKVALERINAEH